MKVKCAKEIHPWKTISIPQTKIRKSFQPRSGTPSSGSTGSGWDNAESYSTGSDLKDRDTARNLKDGATQKAANVRQKISDYTRHVAQKVDASREAVADSLHSTASIVEERDQQVAAASHSLAGKIRDGAEYIRSNDLDNMVEDVTDSRSATPRTPSEQPRSWAF